MTPLDWTHVVRDIPANYVAVGVPAKPVRDIARLRRDSPERWSNFHHG